LTDDNVADGNIDKRNIWLIGAGHTSTSLRKNQWFCVRVGCLAAGHWLSAGSRVWQLHRQNPQN